MATQMWSLSDVDRYERAWAAGFFDGEGWAGAAAQRDRETRQPHARVNQAGVDGVPETLLRFQRALGGLGRIGGPDLVAGRRPIYRWEISSRSDVHTLFELVAPWLGSVKLDQLAIALGEAAQSSATWTDTDEWRAWAAGLYDGEGSTYRLPHRTHAGYWLAQARLTQTSFDESAPEVLVRFQRVVGVGRLYGPYAARPPRRPVYRWNCGVATEIDLALASLWRWLGREKRAQADAVLDPIRSQPPLPRGRPDWQNRKTHCIHGHEYAMARIRPFVARNGGAERRASAQCLVCVREYARAQREQKRSAASDGHRPLSDVALGYLLK